MFMDINVPLKDDNLLVLSFEGSEDKESSPNRFDVGLREAYLDVVSVFGGMKALRLGLIPQTWQEAQYQASNYRFLGRTAWSITEKWKYLSYSDLGASFMSELPADYGEWALSLSNGEGAEEKEKGPHKEAALFVRLFRWSPWSLSFNYVRGNYEVYGESAGLKERIQALISYEEKDDWMVALEFMDAKDPADAIGDYKIAEGVDVSALSGESVQGQAASLYAVVHTGPKAEVMLRYDYLNAAVGETGKNLQTGILALGYQVTDDIKAAIAVDHTHFAEEFAPGVRDRSRVEFAAQVLF
ncbi:hypothetical protein EZJ49_03030 [Bdellovibrio bacteriovorus]|uniref:hypothetical protein n=1 Tax=Bdellovibrio bacteriovorus TaxID=959 RepID=UPI0021D35008|nr:hypothetical protein [Bdellovibrio bacteriovorus]UXR65222.1 hypothetical protein EZJ49_03030 [Bdellovibrio bacteriovorus]